MTEINKKDTYKCEYCGVHYRLKVALDNHKRDYHLKKLKWKNRN
jgi:hypothetical protein